MEGRSGRSIGCTKALRRLNELSVFGELEMGVQLEKVEGGEVKKKCT